MPTTRAQKRALSAMESTTDGTALSSSQMEQRKSPKSQPGSKGAGSGLLEFIAATSVNSSKLTMSNQLTNRDSSSERVDAANRKLADVSQKDEEPPSSWKPLSFWQPPVSLATKDEMERWSNTMFVSGADSSPDAIINDFEFLDLKVLRFVDKYLPHRRPISWESLDAEAQGRLATWAPNAEQHLTNDDDFVRQELMHAWVWRVLFDNLFSEDCRNKWAGRLWAQFDEISQSLQGRVANEDNSFTHSFHSWRTLGARMLYATQGAHVDLAWLKTAFLNELGSVMEMTGKKVEEANEHLEDLLKLAIEAHLRAYSSKAFARFDMCDPESKKLSGFNFKPGGRVMEPYFKSVRGDCHLVDYIYRPGLRIYGTDRKTSHRSQHYPYEPVYMDYDTDRVKRMVVVLGLTEVEDEETDGGEAVADGGKED